MSDKSGHTSTVVLVLAVLVGLGVTACTSARTQVSGSTATTSTAVRSTAVGSTVVASTAVPTTAAPATGGLGGPPNSGARTENAFRTYYNDATQGFATSRTPTSCTYDWGDGSAPESVPVAQCKSYSSQAEAGLATAYTTHNYCTSAAGGLPADGPNGVDCSQLPACPPGPAGDAGTPYSKNRQYTVQLHIVDTLGTFEISRTTGFLPVCS